MRLTKNVYASVKKQARLTRMPMNEEDMVEKWMSFRDWCDLYFRGELTARQLDKLADYAIRWCTIPDFVRNRP